MVGGDVEKARQQVIDAYLDPTARFMTMLSESLERASRLAPMEVRSLVSVSSGAARWWPC